MPEILCSLSTSTRLYKLFLVTLNWLVETVQSNMLMDVVPLDGFVCSSLVNLTHSLELFKFGIVAITIFHFSTLHVRTSHLNQ